MRLGGNSNLAIRFQEGVGVSEAKENRDKRKINPNTLFPRPLENFN